MAGLATIGVGALAIVLLTARLTVARSARRCTCPSSGVSSTARGARDPAPGLPARRVRPRAMEATTTCHPGSTAAGGHAGRDPQSRRRHRATAVHGRHGRPRHLSRPDIIYQDTRSATSRRSGAAAGTVERVVQHGLARPLAGTRPGCATSLDPANSRIRFRSAKLESDPPLDRPRGKRAERTPEPSKLDLGRERQPRRAPFRLQDHSDRETAWARRSCESEQIRSFRLDHL